MKSPNSTSSTTAPPPGRCMRPSVSGYYRWTKPGDASWPNFPGQRETCPRSWVAAPRPCGCSSANIFSSRSSGRAPNPSRARTRADSRQCNALIKTSTNYWRTSIGHSIVCARVASTRNSSMSSPASRRCQTSSVAQPPEGPAMNALSSSRRYGPAQTHAKDQGLHGAAILEAPARCQTRETGID